MASNKKSLNQSENQRIQIEEFESEHKSSIKEDRENLECQNQEIVGEIQDGVDDSFEESISFNVDNLDQKNEDQISNLEDEDLKTFMINRVKEKSTSIPEEIVDQWVNYFIEERTRKDLISEFELEIDALDKIWKTMNYYTTKYNMIL